MQLFPFLLEEGIAAKEAFCKRSSFLWEHLLGNLYNNEKMRKRQFFVLQYWEVLW